MEIKAPSSLRLLRLTAAQHARLRNHLFPMDRCESIALALCGTRFSQSRQVYCVHAVMEIPDETCISRTPTAVRWPVELGLDLFVRAAKRDMAILKIHSHPSGFEGFSKWDDDSDANLLASLSQWTEVPMHHVSAFMLPDGSITARLVGKNQQDWRSVDRVVVVGDEIATFMKSREEATFDGADLRTRQAFGDGTTQTLKSMCVGVAGCSGTGSWVVESLARLGVGRLVLVDPDRVERKNLNRIVNSTGHSAEDKEFKVAILNQAINAMNLGTVVETHATDLAHTSVVKSLAECDVIFGCMDSADGRDLLNRIATFYTIPFIDVGVHLDADGTGGIAQICCAVHYMIPGGSSLLSRGVITAEQISAQALRRIDPAAFQARLKEGYIHGVAVESPAVVSINGFAASHAVNEFLARIHPFRFDDNSEFRHQSFSLRDGTWLRVPDGADCGVLKKRLGRGDCIPLIDSPSIQ